MKTFFRILLQALLLLEGFHANSQSTKDKIDAAERNLVGYIQISGQSPGTLKERMAYYHVPGISIAVIQNYKVIWAKAYGFANDSLKKEVTVNTLFQAGSISKSLNAVGVLKLVQDNRIDLYSDINNYLATWKFPYDSISKGKKITMATLLSHTGGISLHGFPGYHPTDSIPTISQILRGERPANTPGIHSMAEPGKAFVYSGGGVTVAQMAVMDVTRLSYAEFMKLTVLQPLGMTNSTFERQPMTTNLRFATGYDASGHHIPGNYRIYPEQAAAGLWTTPTDLTKYIIETQLAYAGRSAKVLNQENTILRLKPYLNNYSAFGVFIDSADNTKYFQHSGVTEGFRSQYYGSLKSGNGVVVMINSDHNELITEVINSIAKVYGFKGLYKSVIKHVVNVSEDDLQAYTGEYQLAPGFKLTILKIQNQLYAQAPGHGTVKIIPESHNRFFMMEAQVTIEFIKNTTGQVIALNLYDNGVKNEAVKINKK